MRLPSAPITAGPTFSDTRTETPSTSVDPQARLANRTRIALATKPNIITAEKITQATASDPSTVSRKGSTARKNHTPGNIAAGAPAPAPPAERSSRTNVKAGKSNDIIMATAQTRRVGPP